MRPEDANRDVHFHQFFYRINPDKTVDSICAFCYMTAATGETQAELHELERAHRCPERSREVVRRAAGCLLRAPCPLVVKGMRFRISLSIVYSRPTYASVANEGA
jgi:hypothetical protein